MIESIESIVFFWFSKGWLLLLFVEGKPFSWFMEMTDIFFRQRRCVFRMFVIEIRYLRFTSIFILFFIIFRLFLVKDSNNRLKVIGNFYVMGLWISVDFPLGCPEVEGVIVVVLPYELRDGRIILSLSRVLLDDMNNFLDHLLLQLLGLPISPNIIRKTTLKSMALWKIRVHPDFNLPISIHANQIL